MENFHAHEIFVQLLHLLLLLLLSLQCLSSDYTPPSKYFINCGSSSTISDTKRTFVGDESSDSFTLSPKQEAVEDSSPSPATSQLYRTARLFRSPSSYEFDIDQIGIYLVRLHFFPFSSPTDLFTALFDVSVSGLPVLLHNFTVQNTSNLPLIKEFLLTINISKLIVKFEPSQQSSFAFVNAIEVFIAPDSFIPDSALLVTPAGSNNSSYKGISSRVLQKVHRINVGGSDIDPDSDTLWRKWVPDDPYLFNKSAARNRSASKETSYQRTSGYNDSTRYIAPPLVYMSAKEMNKNDSDPLQFFNISWGFNVSKNAKHLLRVHFCDFISSSPYLLLNLYIYGFFSLKIDNIPLGAPFFLDFVVVSDDSGFLNVSVGPQIDSPIKNAFLNGLEIMEIMEELGWVSMEIESKKKTTPLLVGLVVGGLALVCIVIVVLLLRSKCRKEKPAGASHWLPVTVDGGLSSHGRVYEATIHGSPVPHLNLGLKIPLAEIQSATKNFSSKLLVGKGGFGKVYQGTLRNGMKVAVKRSQPGHGQGLPEFQTEILVLSKIRHRHLVSLIGYCDERNEMILVYEFMQNGTLRNHLYDSDLPCLSWKQRLEICIGAARGLHYLHTGSEGGIIHRDVKSTNILLDENFVAKVADFGLSRSGLLHQTHVSTAVKGTIGYLDPEYFRTQKLTEKSDVYSFGVVLLEVLCARPAINPLLPREQVNLAEWVMVRQKEGFLEHVIDPLLVGKVNLNSLRKFGETAEKCLQEDGADRPTMGDVVWDLEYASQLQQTAMQREPLDDSTNDAASTFPLPNVQRYPSYSLTIDGTHVPARRNDGSETTESEVFSQLRIDDGR
ncbi:probable receptor-like protein kinase At5g24010 [Vitis riparia]|uniref:probable receptor-like protein kinase At5g24010 n=1 Tax=Vitis riparia TaxID=96939 RepID=UPI00155AF9EF|nr:probable receptor-like protein kinase At5g24010 [Vitis riparia]